MSDIEFLRGIGRQVAERAIPAQIADDHADVLGASQSRRGNWTDRQYAIRYYESIWREAHQERMLELAPMRRSIRKRVVGDLLQGRLPDEILFDLREEYFDFPSVIWMQEFHEEHAWFLRGETKAEDHGLEGDEGKHG